MRVCVGPRARACGGHGDALAAESVWGAPIDSFRVPLREDGDGQCTVARRVCCRRWPFLSIATSEPPAPAAGAGPGALRPAPRPPISRGWSLSAELRGCMLTCASAGWPAVADRRDLQSDPTVRTSSCLMRARARPNDRRRTRSPAGRGSRCGRASLCDTDTVVPAHTAKRTACSTRARPRRTAQLNTSRVSHSSYKAAEHWRSHLTAATLRAIGASCPCLRALGCSAVHPARVETSPKPARCGCCRSWTWRAASFYGRSAGGSGQPLLTAGAANALSHGDGRE